MPYNSLLEIAGTCFSITYSFPKDQLSTRPEYISFFREENHKQPLSQIDIHLDLGLVPLPDRAKIIFDTDQSWVMFREGDRYHIVFNPPQTEGDPFWHAVANLNWTKVKVHCSDRLFTQHPEPSSVMNPIQYPLDQLLFVNHIATREGALLHAAGMEIRGKGLIFPGRSGAGKSTLSRQFSDSNHLRILSDDRIVIRKITHDYKMFGTPWPGEAGIAKNESTSLSGILFIHHASYNEITEIEPKDAMKQLLPVVSIPWFDEEVMPHLLKFCEGLVTSIPSYNLHFKPTTEVAEHIKDYFT